MTASRLSETHRLDLMPLVALDESRVHWLDLCGAAGDTRAHDVHRGPLKAGRPKAIAQSPKAALVDRFEVTDAGRSTQCFREPERPDLGRPLRSADRIQWLRRSGLARAVALRRFLNENLAALPPDAADSLCARFRTSWDKTAYFELIVGRFLQLSGATLTYEPLGTGTRRVDFMAAFAGGTVFVEATSPQYNEAGVTDARYQEPLLDIVEAAVPYGWRALIQRLPDHGANDSRKRFRREVQRLFADLPDPASTDQAVNLDVAFPSGHFSVTLEPGRADDADALAMYPGQHLRENSGERISAAIRGKRDQAREFRDLGPVILALDSAWYTDEDDFDGALFGGTYDTVMPDRSLSPVSFHPTGELATQRDAEFAAVLVFRDLGFARGSDPTLYIHPRFTGSLPSQLDFLERKEMTPSGIRVTPATETGVLERLPFMTLAEFTDNAVHASYRPDSDS